MADGRVYWRIWQAGQAYQTASAVQATVQLASKSPLPGIRERIDTSARLLRSTGSNWSRVAVTTFAIDPADVTRTCIRSRAELPEARVPTVQRPVAELYVP